MSFASKLKGVDFYRAIPKDLTEPTAPGAVLSIVATVVMFTLFVGEIASFINPEPRTDMFVAQDQEGTRMKVNVNMTYHKLPCFALSFDVLDALGRHEVGMAGGLVHKRTNGGYSGAQPLTINDEWTEEKYDSKIWPSQTHEGCNVAGFVTVNKVPGNFHISAHGLGDRVQQYLKGRMNVVHTIHSLWLGDVEATGNHEYEGEVHPLNNHEELALDKVYHYEYHLQVVPTLYERRWKSERGYQMTVSANKQEITPGHMPAAFFRYALSPITVRFGTEQRSFLHFITYLCAIVGGVFTVAGMIAKTMHKTIKQFQKNAMGKQF